MWLAVKRIGFSALRVWLGIQWLDAGLGKVGAPSWTGDQAGTSLAGFVKGAVAKSVGDHPSVQGWYANFLDGFILPNAPLFSHLVAWGEVLVGLGLILGMFTGFAAAAGAMMNLNFMLAGTTSTNPILYTAAIVVLAGIGYAQYYGLDSYVRPKVEWAAVKSAAKIRAKLVKQVA